jgi:hypothetical protein
VVSYDVEYSEELWHVAVLLELATSKWLLMRGPVLSFFFGGVAMPWSSQRILQVPKLVTKMFPIISHLYPIWFAQSSTLMYINVKCGSREHPFHNWLSKEVLLLGSALQRFGDGPINMAPFWKNEVWAHTHELINMNHKQVHLLFARVNNSSQKWWQIVLGIEFVGSQWNGWTCTLHDISFFTQGWGVWGFFLPFYNSAPLPRGVWIFSFNKSALLTHATHARVNWCLILI